MKNVWDAKSQYEKYASQKIYDCYIAQALLSEGKYTPTLIDTLKRYNVKDLNEIAKKQQLEFKEYPQLSSLFYDVEMPLSKVLWNMEQKGITLNTKKLIKLGEEIKLEIQKIESEIYKIIGYEINLKSSLQVGNYLADKLGVPLQLTKTGKFMTNESELRKFEKQFDIIHKILKHRELAKLYSTYVQSLVDKVDKKNKIHTTYHQVAISTGRLASSNPNLQNIPVTSDFGKKIKSCFEPSPGYTLVSFDYSQQELRILAHLSGEKKMIKAFQQNKDVHSITASQIFQVEYKDVTVQQRKVAKTINFGIIYGMSAYGLSESLSIPVEDANLFIQNFYDTFPQIKLYYDNYLKNAKINRFVTTILGRRRYVFESDSYNLIDNGMKRVLMNYPIQGSAADLIKKTMVEIDRQILQTSPDIHLLLQIHDDLVFEIKNNDVKYFKSAIKRITDIMKISFQLSVSMDVKVNFGKNWGEMKSYE